MIADAAYDLHKSLLVYLYLTYNYMIIQPIKLANNINIGNFIDISQIINDKKKILLNHLIQIKFDGW